MQIGDFNVKDKVLIVAEIGNNHEGNFDVAKRLVYEAAECGADAVKFQTFRTEHYVSRSNVQRFNRLKSFELSYQQFEKLSELAHSLGLLFLSTPFDVESAEFLTGIVDAFKIASADNTFYHLISQVARTRKPLIISLGLADAHQVARTISFVQEQWAEKTISGQLAILHCVSSYPVPPEQANLRSIEFLAKHFDCVVGYSDHTIGIDAALLAVALGARILEKHFTLHKSFSAFRDHQLSSDPREMRELVQRVRLACSMLGECEKTVQPCEQSAAEEVRRSIVAGADLPAGHRLGLSDITWIRPAGGLASGEEHFLVGKILTRPVRFGEQLHPSDAA